MYVQTLKNRTKVKIFTLLCVGNHVSHIYFHGHLKRFLTMNFACYDVQELKTVEPFLER